MSLELVLVRARQLCKLFISKVVGAIGFEPTTSWSQTRRSTKLSYTPMSAAFGSKAHCQYVCWRQNGKQKRPPRHAVATQTGVRPRRGGLAIDGFGNVEEPFF